MHRVGPLGHVATNEVYRDRFTRETGAMDENPVESTAVAMDEDPVPLAQCGDRKPVGAFSGPAFPGASVVNPARGRRIPPQSSASPHETDQHP